MSDALMWHRIQFIFTITYHYLFPQLTMGLALYIVAFKAQAIRLRDSSFNDVTHFWGRIFALNFAMGVVTGIPMEFQFGTNWSAFSRYSGEVVGHTLAIEGLFAFFLESAFLGLFLYGERRLGPIGHLAVSVALGLGSWISGYFIIVANAFMQHPVGYRIGEDGALHLESFWAFILNPWALWQFAHNMSASVVTASFVVAAVGAYWSLMGRHARSAEICLKSGVIGGLIASLAVAFPTGDAAGKLVAKHQPVTLAAMEGLFEGGTYAELAIIGQPNVASRRLENPVVVPWILSFLCYGSFGSTVQGLNDFPVDQWPQNIELLYYCYHIMAGLGTLFILTMGGAAFLLWRGQLTATRPMLWVLMLAFPFPYIATTAGWWTAELGRQPWLIYGLMRTSEGHSKLVNPGDVIFTLLGFAGLYLLLGMLFVVQIAREVDRGPSATH